MEIYTRIAEGVTFFMFLFWLKLETKTGLRLFKVQSATIQLSQ